MVSLINPTPGELLDRKTILRLKIEAGRRQKLDVAHFEEELRLIDAALSDWLQKDADASQQLFAEGEKGLAEVNQKLWHAEDEVRETPTTDKNRLAELAKLIPELNDHRAALVQRVNGLFRVAQAEKIYR